MPKMSGRFQRRWWISDMSITESVGMSQCGKSQFSLHQNLKCMGSYSRKDLNIIIYRKVENWGENWVYTMNKTEVLSVP